MNKTSGTCDYFLWPVLLIIKNKLPVEIPEEQKSTGDYIEKLE